MLGLLDDRGGQVRAGVEQIVLDLPQHGENPLVGRAECDGHAERRVRFVAIGVGLESRVVLGYPAEIAESR